MATIKRNLKSETLSKHLPPRKVFQNALQATGDTVILYTVADQNWGTGGENTQAGRNRYGHILMEERE